MTFMVTLGQSINFFCIGLDQGIHRVRQLHQAIYWIVPATFDLNQIAHSAEGQGIKQSMMYPARRLSYSRYIVLFEWSMLPEFIPPCIQHGGIIPPVNHQVMTPTIDRQILLSIVRPHVSNTTHGLKMPLHETFGRLWIRLLRMRVYGRRGQGF